MSSFLCITVSFLQPLSHARGADGEPEWPPSPLRLFQALIAASAARWNERQRVSHAAEALRWLEMQSPPLIVAAPVKKGARHRLYVPDNTSDKFVSSWKRGDSASLVGKRTEKDVHRLHLGQAEVHFVYGIDSPNEYSRYVETLKQAARSMTHLGWGIDMIAGNIELLSSAEVAQLRGERWSAHEGWSAVTRRIPVVGTMDDLSMRHEAFLGRLANDSFTPVPPLSKYRVVGYCRATDPLPRPWAAFGILKPDASGNRTFDTTRRTRDVAGMVRCAIKNLARQHGWSEQEINVCVHGKSPDGTGPARGTGSPQRFQYLALPTIAHMKQGGYDRRRVEAIRRFIVVGPSEFTDRIDWLRRGLAGELLTNDHGDKVGLVTIIPNSDWVTRQYTGRAQAWSTVTPVILPRHEGYDVDSAEDEIRMAFEQAGFARELLESAELEWRRVGYFPGTDLASRYLPPENLKNKPRYHIRVRFPTEIAGPIAVGSGRFRGFGLFAAAG